MNTPIMSPPPTSGDAIIEAHGLVKRFGATQALAGLDLTVAEGTVLGLLGPNGAGKTTAVSILTTLLVPDSGTAVVAGADVVTSPGEVRKRIGLSGQYAAVDEKLTGFENLDLIRAPLPARTQALAGESSSSCSSVSASPKRPAGPSAPTREACDAASTSPAPWSPSPRCSF